MGKVQRGTGVESSMSKPKKKQPYPFQIVFLVKGQHTEPQNMLWGLTYGKEPRSINITSAQNHLQESHHVPVVQVLLELSGMWSHHFPREPAAVPNHSE